MRVDAMRRMVIDRAQPQPAPELAPRLVDALELLYPNAMLTTAGLVAGEGAYRRVADLLGAGAAVHRAVLIVK